MSTYIDGHTMRLADVNGFHASVPTRVVHLLANSANQSDDGTAYFGLRCFDRDALNGARDLLDQRDPCTFTSAAGDCDRPAVFDLANARPRCETHPTHDQGA